MSDDLLERATRAAREELDGDPAAGELGRRRLERALAKKAPVRGRRRMQALVLIAASFAGLSAWASVTNRLPRFLRTEVPATTTAPSPPPVEPIVRAGHPLEVVASSSAEPVPEPPPAPPTVPVARPKAPTPGPAPESPKIAASPAPVVDGQARASTRSPSESVVDVDALYREASDAHFMRKDPELALAAWDRYLAAAGPAGRMTIEARYNRALALVRLGRKGEARDALEPFARGEYGGYRKDDAMRLIDSLR